MLELSFTVKKIIPDSFRLVHDRVNHKITKLIISLSGNNSQSIHNDGYRFSWLAFYCLYRHVIPERLKKDTSNVFVVTPLASAVLGGRIGITVIGQSGQNTLPQQ